MRGGMMRDLKFRIWDKEGKKMRYEMTGLHCDFDFCNPLLWYFENRVVMQYTGLKDKNGKEIYEGDILQECEESCRIWEDHYENAIITKCPTGIVEYQAPIFNVKRLSVGEVDLGNGEFSELYMNHYDGVYTWISEHCDYEVIGNIYENPELLRSKDNIEEA
jgi:uncharacterized phage protein (TIGR01671 family)